MADPEKENRQYRITARRSPQQLSANGARRRFSGDGVGAHAKLPEQDFRMIVAAAPDGYSLLYCANSVVVIRPNPKVNYTLEEVAPVSLAARCPLALYSPYIRRYVLGVVE